MEVSALTVRLGLYPKAGRRCTSCVARILCTAELERRGMRNWWLGERERESGNERRKRKERGDCGDLDLTLKKKRERNGTEPLRQLQPLWCLISNSTHSLFSFTHTHPGHTQSPTPPPLSPPPSSIAPPLSLPSPDQGISSNSGQTVVGRVTGRFDTSFSTR